MSGIDPDLFARAAALAARFHFDQRRKGTDIPYFSHVAAVAALVMEDGGSDTEIAAALLHDAAEDQGGDDALALIADELDEEVASIVRECSDSVLPVGGQKVPWRERKEAAVSALPTRSVSALKVIGADKLHNTRSTLADLELEGDLVWDRFRTGREGFVWYHQAMSESLSVLLPSSRSVRLLAIEVARL